MRMTILLAAAVMIAAGCDKQPAKPKDDAGKSASAGGNGPGAFAGHLLAAEPSGPVRQVKDVRDNAKDGDTVVVAGRVQDFVADRAVFVLIDNSLQPCNEKEGDGCKTPWDYCCDAPEVQKANKFAVRLADATGAVIMSPLKGTLNHLDKVVVTGKVAKSADGNVTLVAAGVFNKGGGIK